MVHVLCSVVTVCDSCSSTELKVGLGAGGMDSTSEFEVTVTEEDSVGCTPVIRMVPLGCSATNEPVSGSGSKEMFGLGAGGVSSSIGFEETVIEGDSVDCAASMVRIVPDVSAFPDDFVSSSKSFVLGVVVVFSLSSSRLKLKAYSTLGGASTGAFVDST